MNAHRLTSTLLTLAVMISSPAAWCADAASDAAKVTLQGASLKEIKTLAEAACGYKAKDIELSSTAHQMTLTIINSKLNTAAPSKREAEATRAVSALACAMTDKPAFSELPVIHVDYVERQGGTLKAVQRIDFFQSPAGGFVLHKT